ncbi:EF-hand domain-containing protein [Frigoriflavimonas asaccharolytica]|uniref:Ca2+-binding EF-hand superfamily protein n=1 Tax=Frigoriflavimonas asaccharolytica TaxID=2735899 RepID=A0A8J8GC60_9FLAO|nr:EF-hand domain-containing protein [Frigoriflavimonas asaccharolytica]NRS93822.1 Ca2+-binding EF-hand superfamily protein [Frigoriflavimonas asaccharolytica]
MNFSKELKTGAITLGFLLLGTFVSAQSTQEKKGGQKMTPTESMEKLDANKDGKLSEKEAKGFFKENFAKIDTDKDGFLSIKELEKAPKPEGRGEGRPKR